MDLEAITAQVHSTNNALLKLIEDLAADPLSQTTRSHIDKLLLAGAFCVLVGTFGSPAKITIGGADFQINSPHALPLFLTLVVVFYIVAVAILAISDRRKWRSIYTQRKYEIDPFITLLQNMRIEHHTLLEAQMADLQRRFKAGDDLGAPDKEGIPQAIRDAADEAKQWRQTMNGLSDILLLPMRKAKTQFRLSMGIFVILPSMLGIASVAFTIWTLARTS